MTLETRALSAPVDVVGEDKRTAVGYAALFNERANIAGAFDEQIAPGAFDGFGDVLALVDHDTGRVIGRTTSGTLRLEQDARGLRVEVDLPDTQDGRDLAVQLGRGDISGMSFGFRVTGDEWDESGDMPLRTIRSVDLIEVSAVALPAYKETEIALRQADIAMQSLEKHRKQQNFRAASKRLARKVHLDLSVRR